MPSFVDLLLAYGVTFGLMNKLPEFLYDRMPNVIQALLACAYCVGFHAGWISYLLASAAEGTTIHPAYIPLWAFASGAFSYGADALLRMAESHTHLDLGDDDE